MRISIPESENPSAPRSRLVRRAAQSEPAVFHSADWVPVPEGKTFREAYCARYRIVPERYEIDLFLRCLPWRARMFRPLLGLFRKHYFSIDRMFVRSIGDARTATGLMAEIKEFRYDSRNMTWLRNRLRLRLSTNRLLDVAQEVAPHLAQRTTLGMSVSAPPFGRS